MNNYFKAALLLAAPFALVACEERAPEPRPLPTTTPNPEAPCEPSDIQPLMQQDEECP